jgi:hypothetical protein
VSPILVRPVREQLEHDRIIRLLQLKYRRKYEAAINPGTEQNAPVGTLPFIMYPDVVLQSPDRRHRLLGVVEVETGESVNHLEALAEWAHFGKLRGTFHLYVPATMVDVARRLCEDSQISVSEVWSYHTIGNHRPPRCARLRRRLALSCPVATNRRKPHGPQNRLKSCRNDKSESNSIARNGLSSIFS